MIKDEKPDKLEEFVTTTAKKVREKSFSDYLDTSIVLMIIGIILAIIITFFVEFIFSPDFDVREVGVNTILITACTIAVYLLVRYYSMRKGRKTQVWNKAKEEMLLKGREIIDKDKAKYISEYCRDWEDKRLKDDISVVLSPVGITYEDFKENYAKLGKSELKKKFPQLTKIQQTIIAKAKKVKRLKFDERYFYVNAEGGRFHRSPSSGLNTKQLNRLSVVRIVVTSVITSLVSATMLRDILVDFSAEAIVKCVVKLAIIIFFGAIGMIGGYTFSTVRETSEMQAKADEIDIFLKWCENKKDG